MSEVGNATTGSDVLQRLTSGIRQNSEPTYALVGVALNSLREDPVITEAYNHAVAEYRGRVAHAVDRIGALGVVTAEVGDDGGAGDGAVAS